MVWSKRRALVASFLLTCVAVFSGKKISDYSAPPKGPKSCEFAIPGDPTDNKPTTILIKPEDLPAFLEDQDGFINDASCLNKTRVYGIARIRTVEDVRASMEFARANHLKISVAGQRHSMGGQAFSKDGLVLDMRDFNAITLDRSRKVVRVQSGTTWAQIQQLIDKEGLSIQAMQSINVFTIGGSLSVNAHGIAHRPGPVASTVQSMRIMLTNGEIRNASQTENSELFRLVLGGYGLFGVILDADIQLVDNEIYSLETHELDFRQFPAYYRTHVAEDDSVGLMYGRISISPTSYLRETAIHIYRKTDLDGPIPPIQPSTHDRLDRLVINFSKTGAFGRWLRWTLEKRLGPKLQ
jgi:FAD/FMN-containing dehydrogenase